MIENTQKALPADYQASGVVRIHSIFKTIQGEGPFTGERALFIRLFGCNLMCPGCDTEYTSVDNAVSPLFMMSEALRLGWPQGALVVITGGEPFRQNIIPSVKQLILAGYRVQIETNGIFAPPGLAQLFAPPYRDLFSIVCSPKTMKIHPMIHDAASAFKYVLRADDVNPDDGLPNKALLHKAAPFVARPRPGALVYVQPMDERDPAADARNMDAAIASTMAFGHRLQVQVHKQIGME